MPYLTAWHTDQTTVTRIASNIANFGRRSPLWPLAIGELAEELGSLISIPVITVVVVGVIIAAMVIVVMVVGVIAVTVVICRSSCRRESAEQQA
jgi:hypothetical protein